MRISPRRMSQNVCQAESVSYTWQIPQRYCLNCPHGARYVAERAPPGSAIFPVLIMVIFQSTWPQLDISPCSY